MDIKRIIILIVTILTIIFGVIVGTRRGKGKDVKDNISNIANRATDAITDTVSKGIGGTANVLNKVSSSIESKYFFEKDNVQSVSTAILTVVPFIIIFLAFRENNKSYNFIKDPEFYKGLPILLLIYLLSSLGVECLILVFLTLISITIKESFGNVFSLKSFSTLKKCFFSRFYWHSSIKVLLLRFLIYLVIFVIAVVAAFGGIVKTVCCGYCKNDGKPCCLESLASF